MSDMLKDVALALYREDLNHPEAERVPGILRNYNERMAQAAISAATPHIRAALFDELIAEAGGEEHSPIMYYKTNGQGAFMGATTVGNWLTEQKNKENTQP